MGISFQLLNESFSAAGPQEHWRAHVRPVFQLLNESFSAAGFEADTFSAYIDAVSAAK